MITNGRVANGTLQRKMTVNFAALNDDDDEFFETRDRMSSAVPNDLASSDCSSEDEFFDDTRMSFTSSSPEEFRGVSGFGASATAIAAPDYNMWMAEPCSITERRKKLFQGMGMGMSNKELFRLSSSEFQRAVTKKIGNTSKKMERVATVKVPESKNGPGEEDGPVILSGSRSEGEIDFPAVAKRKEDFFGPTSKQRLTRTSTTLVGPCVTRAGRRSDMIRASPKRRRKSGSSLPPAVSNTFGGFFLIKNLDTGKEFIVNDYDNRLSDLQTGKRLTMEEFEKTVGHSPVVTELMKRSGMMNGDNRKLTSGNSYLSKSLKTSKRHGSNLLKNISRSVSSSVSGFIADRDGLPPIPNQEAKSKGSEWVRVRQHGKSYKEFSALQLSQEIQAHEGSIWTIRFSPDGQFLASAGEDRTVHVWEVQECDLMTMRQPEDWTLTPLHPSACPSPERQLSGVVDPSASPGPSFEAKKKKGKGAPNGKKGLPDYVFVPETVFALSERPICSFKGHQDDVLDLSWSKSQLLLSSSMDKTVRLWDLESGSCLKMFAHNDYVTCIQFNPINDDYFISGSLDAKVRIWSIPNRQVVDWSDLHEMVTAVCYTPDGEGATVGTHKGNIRVYSTEDCKLDQKDQIEIQNKKKGGGKKITGFQYSPWNPSELLVTSADSRVRIREGADTTHKFKGFKNTNSQIAASFTSDAKYVVCASEDSQVFVWKKEMQRNGSAAKPRVPIDVVSYESFCCKDVSMAIPWPGNLRCEPPVAAVGSSKRHSKRYPPSPSNCGSEENENSNRRSSEASKRNLPPLPKKANPKEKEKKNKEKKEKEVEEVSTPLANTEETESPPANRGEIESPPANRGKQRRDRGETESPTANREESESPTENKAETDSPKANTGETESPTAAEEEQAQLSRLGSVASGRYGSESPSISSAANSSGPSWLSMFDGGATSGMQSSAWGMVIVTAGLGGEIRTYQNFGLPRKVGRQGNLLS